MHALEMVDSWHRKCNLSVLIDTYLADYHKLKYKYLKKRYEQSTSDNGGRHDIFILDDCVALDILRILFNSETLFGV